MESPKTIINTWTERLGNIDVEKSALFWRLKTSNIRRWHFGKPRMRKGAFPARVIIDDQEFELLDSIDNEFLCLDGVEWLVSMRNALSLPYCGLF